MVKRYTADDMVQAWENLEDVYELFRKENGLVDSDYNAFEICTALSDKHGRICREVKHAERNDHKQDWPDGLTSAMAGYIVYMIMLLKKYKCDFTNGLEKELNSSLKQYGKIDSPDDITPKDVAESQEEIDMRKDVESLEMGNGSKFYCHVDPAIGKDKSSIMRGFTTYSISSEDLAESIEILENCNNNFGFVKEKI